MGACFGHLSVVICHWAVGSVLENDAGCRMVDTGCWILDAGSWILDVQQLSCKLHFHLEP
jgi:hypothetical protein